MNLYDLSLIGAGLLVLWALWGRFRASREEVKLRAKLREYETRLHYKGEISNEIAHDIKNPLTAILCSAEALELIASPQLDSESRKTLRYIREYGDQMLKLITDFLDVNLAEAGRLRTNPEKIKIKDVIDSVTVLLRSTALNKNLKVTVSEISDDAVTYFDPKHIKQILFNLVHNAIKFTPPHGQVTISVVPLRDFDSLCIGISDTGPGIPAESLDSLFDPYSPSVRKLNSIEKGTGIGLSLCKNLTELGSGSIQVRSTVGVGTTFEVIVPLVEAEHIVFEPAWANDKPLLGQHVLIVDRDMGARETMATLIGALGGIAETADQIENALQALMSQTFSAVMIDSKADDGAGYALAKIIKHDLDAKHTKVILSGDAIIDASLAYEFGVDSCIQKPLSSKQIVKSIL